MDLATPLDLICRIIIRAREVEAQVPGIDPENDDPVNDSDDERDVLEDELDETAVDELRSAIADLADDQQIELLALAMVGQGTYDASEWDDAMEEAGDANSEPAIDLLLDMPTLSENLEAGLAAFDLSCEGVGQID
jgi:DNA-directed RNA polymerase specialized sigma24 family protein